MEIPAASPQILGWCESVWKLTNTLAYNMIVFILVLNNHQAGRHWELGKASSPRIFTFLGKITVVRQCVWAPEFSNAAQLLLLTRDNGSHKLQVSLG